MKVLIIGGSGGIGSALCRQMGEGGHEVHATYRSNQAPLNGISGLTPAHLDLGDAASVQALCGRIRNGAYQGLALLAASPMPRQFFYKSDPAAWSGSVRQGLDTAVLITHAFAEAAKRFGLGGSIVYLLSSVVLGIPPEKQSAYVTLKHALLGLSRSQSAEFRHLGIRVNSVSPGMTRTGFNADLPERFVETYQATLPMGRLAEPGEVASAVRFLLENHSSYISGVNLPVTGGDRC